MPVDPGNIPRTRHQVKPNLAREFVIQGYRHTVLVSVIAGNISQTRVRVVPPLVCEYVTQDYRSLGTVALERFYERDIGLYLLPLRSLSNATQNGLDPRLHQVGFLFN